METLELTNSEMNLLKVSAQNGPDFLIYSAERIAEKHGTEDTGLVYISHIVKLHQD